MRRAVALLGACHPGPAFAVTVLAGLLARAVGLAPGGIALVVVAVLAGQLSIGWSNDLIDLARDRTVGRADKPLVDGRVSEPTVRLACGGAGGGGGAPAPAPAGAAGCPSRPCGSPVEWRWWRRCRCRWPAAGWPGSCTWSAWPPAGPTTWASRRRRGRGCRTPSPSAACRPSSP